MTQMNNIDSTIMSVSSLEEFVMKCQLIYGVPLNSVTGMRIILGRWFGSNRLIPFDVLNAVDTSNIEEQAAIAKHIYNIIHETNDERVIRECFLSKEIYTILCFKMMDAIMEADIGTFGGRSPWSIVSQREVIERFCLMSKIIYRHDSEFIKSLKDKDDNNMLMILSKMWEFDKKIMLLRRALNIESEDDEKSKLDDIFKIFSHGWDIVTTLIALGCDPYKTNRYNQCFANYFTERKIKEMTDYLLEPENDDE